MNRLSVSLCFLFQTFLVNGTIQSVVFCVRLRPLSMSSRFIYVVACIRYTIAFFVFLQMNKIVLYGFTAFYVTSHQWMDI